MRHLLNMDPPEHARYRRLASGWFTPRAIRGMDDKVARVTREVLDAAAGTTEGDFVQDVSARITIAVIAEMLGVPRRDWELLFRWTNEIIAPQDPEFQHGQTAEETIERARIEVFAYFHELAERRRAEPTDDIVSVIANGQLNGEPLAAGRAPVVLLPARRRRERDHAERDDGRHARLPRASRRMAEAPREPRAPRHRRRGDRALDDAGHPVRPHGDP